MYIIIQTKVQIHHIFNQKKFQLYTENVFHPAPDLYICIFIVTSFTARRTKIFNIDIL